MKIPPRTLSRVRDYLLEVASDTGSMEAQGLAEDLKRYVKAPKKTLPGVSKSVAKRLKVQTRQLTSAQIRAAVMRRADGRCEACTGPLGLSGVWDHWLGGSGRRKALESVETTWALCAYCNHQRTDNIPSAKHWNRRFQTHCDTHGYPFTPHKERA